MKCCPSIAPHWNWNLKKRLLFHSYDQAFNRTSLELKCGWSNRVSYGSTTFNRTSLELKSIYIMAKQLLNKNLQSHLTGIEIRGQKLHQQISRGPSIAPHWNWNSFKKSLTSSSISAFNRTSLELKYLRGKVISSLFFSLQSHLTGIEIGFTYMIANGENVPSIAPHWNWNRFSGASLHLLERSFNRTSLELK